MSPDTIFDKIKSFIGRNAFNIFLWSISMTQEAYWKAIYEQEKTVETT